MHVSCVEHKFFLKCFYVASNVLVAILSISLPATFLHHLVPYVGYPSARDEVDEEDEEDHVQDPEDHVGPADIK